MVTHDRIRLTGLLQKKPWKRGFFYPCCLTGDSSGAPRGGQTKDMGSSPGVEPLAVTTGLRRSELCGLRDWRDLDLGAAAPTLLVRRAKGGELRRQPLPRHVAREELFAAAGRLEDIATRNASVP